MIIQKLLFSSSFKKYNVKIEYLEENSNEDSLNEMFIIDKYGKIIFLHKYNLLQFRYDLKSCKINGLININIKNEKTYEIIKVLQSLQNDFIVSNNLKDLKDISYDDIIKKHQNMFQGYIAKNIISYVLKNTRYKDRDNNIMKLSFLRPSKNFLQYIKIKSILHKYPDASDLLIQKNLQKDFQIKLSTVQISKIRKRYFIPKKSQRNKLIPYQRFQKYFTPIQKLTKENLALYKKLGVVYELIDQKVIEYNFATSKTLYIGSTKNLSVRLNCYISNYAHTEKLKDYMEKHTVYFRFIVTNNYKEIERILLQEFQEYYGGLPLLNTNGSYI
jgi:hypothetical protein